MNLLLGAVFYYLICSHNTDEKRRTNKMKRERVLLQQTDKINDLLARCGVKFGI